LRKYSSLVPPSQTGLLGANTNDFCTANNRCSGARSPPVRCATRRLAALRLMAPELDANDCACAAAHRPPDSVADASRAEATSP
jgi:hypothetical protein